MIIDGHTLPWYFAHSSCKPTTKTPYNDSWSSNDFRLIFTHQDFVERMIKIEERLWVKTDSLYTFIPFKEI